MRLICPNCDAQYEVDENVIPDEGRDVQCSNCSQTWFQKSAKALAAIDSDDEANDSETADDASQDDETTDAVSPDDAVDDVSGKDAKSDDTDSGDKEPERRALDQAVLDVLRQEAELEESARLVETTDTLESQPDLGLADGGTAAAAAAKSQLDDADVSDVTDRRELLPDIEEINSSLTADEDRDDPDGEGDLEAPQRRSRFRFGFLLMLFLLAICVAIYNYAPNIIEAWPAGEDTVRAYVGFVNDLRVKVDGAMTSTIDSISGMLEGSE